MTCKGRKRERERERERKKTRKGRKREKEQLDRRSTGSDRRNTAPIAILPSRQSRSQHRAARSCTQIAAPHHAAPPISLFLDLLLPFEPGLIVAAPHRTALIAISPLRRSQLRNGWVLMNLTGFDEFFFIGFFFFFPCVYLLRNGIIYLFGS